MDTQRRFLVLASSAWLTGALAGCGGGSDAVADQTPFSAPLLAGSPPTLQALVPVTLVLAEPDATSTYALQADIGRGLMVDLVPNGPGRFDFTPPVGVLGTDGHWHSGEVVLTLKRSRGTEFAQTVLRLPLALPTPVGTAGRATALSLRATQLMAQRSLSQMGLLVSKLPQGLNLSGVAAAANQLNARFAELEALVRTAMAGQPASLEFGGGIKLPLSPALLAQLDAHAQALQASLAFKATTAAGHAHALAADGKVQALADADDFEADARALSQTMAEAARRVSGAVGSTVGLAATVVAVGAGLAGATPLALAAGGVAATAWMVSTLYGTAVGAALDGGTATLLDGQAGWQDFAPSGKFFWDQYLSLAKDKLVSIGAKLPLGGKLEDTISLAYSAADTYQSVTELSLLPAFESGALDKAGYPASSFGLAVQATASPYVVRVSASAGGASAHIRLQISGTDGYVFNSDATLSGGQAQFQPQPAQAGSGVVDTINVFDLDGRASASTTVSF